MADRPLKDFDGQGLSSDSEELSEAAAPARPAWSRVSPAARAITVGVLGACCMAAVLLRPPPKKGASPTVHDEFLHRPLPPSPMRELQTVVDWDESQGVLAREADGMPGMPPSTVNAPAVYAGNIGEWKGGPPPTSIHDVVSPGMKCRKNEELFLGVCYKNCTLLTGGMYPIRFAPNGCCKDYPCMTPSEVDMQGFAPGTGYIVSAEGDGHYPHSPGECSGNEESHMGLCYKKCSLLTNNEYPHRVAANTCCRQSPCWNPFNLDTQGKYCEGYGVGGGLSREEQCPHKPLANSVSS